MHAYKIDRRFWRTPTLSLFPSRVNLEMNNFFRTRKSAINVKFLYFSQGQHASVIS